MLPKAAFSRFSLPDGTLTTYDSILNGVFLMPREYIPNCTPRLDDDCLPYLVPAPWVVVAIRIVGRMQHTPADH